MILAQISDTHIALDTQDADQRLQDFERTIAAINALDPPPDVIVHTGDIVHNGRQDEYAEAVRADMAQARAYGIKGVPFYVIDDRYGISGAQPPEVFTEVLTRAAADHAGQPADDG